ncbi:MAG: DUF5930 domain-containing protein [Pseudomonadota bacterium]
MPNGVARVVNRGLRGLIAERRVFIRTEQSTRLVTITPLTQISVCVLLAGLFGWSGYSAFLVGSAQIHAHRAMLAQDANGIALEARIAGLQATQDELEDERHAALAQSRASATKLGASQEALLDAQEAVRRMRTEREALHAEVRALATERAAQAVRLTKLEASLRETQLAMLDDALAPRSPEPRVDMMSGVMLSSAMADLIAERDRALAERREGDARIAELNERIGSWQQREQLILAKLEGAARTGLDSLGRVLQDADLDIDEILERTRESYSGAGGPFEPLTDAEAALLDDEAETDTRIASLMSDLEQVNLMRVAVERLPFGMPVHGARKTSGFGKRRDPFRRTWSMHNGVDWAGPRGTPIYSTAAGVVSFSGRQRGYGIVVVIKHAFGYETRYAHLDKSLVEVGQRVERGLKIGKMGNTGRSTGTHLHYEIRVGEEPINPTKFIEAARDVL